MIRLSGTVVASRLDDELVLLDQASGKYFGLNESGSRIYRLIEELGDEEDIIAALARDYGLPEERMRADLAAFLAALRDRGFIEDALP